MQQTLGVNTFQCSYYDEVWTMVIFTLPYSWFSSDVIKIKKNKELRKLSYSSLFLYF